MRVRGMFVLVFFLLLLTVCTAPGAASTSNGASGLLRIPTTATLSQGSFRIGYHYADQENIGSLTLGLYPGVEASVSSVLRDGLTAVTAHGKVRVLDEDAAMPALALGVESHSDGPGFYAVASKQVGTPMLRAHVGWGTRQFNGFFGGLGYLVNPVSARSNAGITVPPTTAAVEYDGRKWHAGVKMDLTEEFEGRLYVTDFSSIGFNVSYTTRF